MLCLLNAAVLDTHAHTCAHTRTATQKTRTEMYRDTDRQTDRQRHACVAASDRSAQLLNEAVKQWRRCNSDEDTTDAYTTDDYADD